MAIVLRSELRFEALPSREPATIAEEQVDYREFVFRLALAICGERDGAEDVAQDVMLTLYNRRKKVALLDNPHAWIRRVTIRSAVRYLKRQPRTEPLAEDLPKEENTDGSIAVYQVLKKLDAEQRAILGMAINQGLSYREIAEAMGVPEGTVGSRLNAAKKAFQKRWTE